MGRSLFALSMMLPLMACQQAAPLEVKEVWARDTIGGTANGAVYMTIVSPLADRLVSAATPIAAKTDLMTMTTANGTMGMNYLQAIDIPAGKPVSLNATGLHVWLAGLKQPLKAGQSFPLTLTFEKAGTRQVTVSVVAAAAPSPMPGM